MERELYNLKTKILRSEHISDDLREELANDVFEIEKLVNKTNDTSDTSGSKQIIEALHELVQVKEYKDKYGKDEQYETAMKQAWKNAKDLIDTYYR
jgi:hypothetical protein